MANDSEKLQELKDYLASKFGREGKEVVAAIEKMVTTTNEDLADEVDQLRTRIARLEQGLGVS